MQQRLEVPPEPGMTIAGHLEELRRRLGLCLLAWLVATGASLAYAGQLIAWLHRPAVRDIPQLAALSPTEPLIAYIRVAVLGGFVLAMPVWLAQLWGFVRPGLKPSEQLLGVTMIWWGSAQFFLGAAVAYYVLLPVSLRVLLSVGAHTILPIISVDRYLSFSTSLLVWCGVVFELPVVLSVLAKVGIVTPEWLRQQRPYAVLVLVIVAALITPTTDPVNLLLMVIPLLGLYEVSIVIARWMRPPVSSQELPSSR